MAKFYGKIRNEVKRMIAVWASRHTEDLRRHNEDIALYGELYKKTVCYDMMELKMRFIELIIEIGIAI